MSLNQMEATEFGNISTESIKKSDKNSTLTESKKTNIDASMHPITPALAEVKVKFTPNDFPSSSTPIKDVFDSYTSDSIQKKQSGSLALRKLNFVSENKSNKSDDGLLMETVYESMLEAIIRKEAEDVLADILASEADSSRDVFMTPPARVGVLACPGAPSKPKQVGNKRDVDLSLCRKLNFDSLV